MNPVLGLGEDIVQYFSDRIAAGSCHWESCLIHLRRWCMRSMGTSTFSSTFQRRVRTF